MLTKSFGTAKDAKGTKRYKYLVFILTCFVALSFFGANVIKVRAEFVNNKAVSNFEQETDQFLKAKELVFKGNWNQARIHLEKYLVNYTDGSYRDEAYYWLARSLNKLSREEVIVEKVIALKEEAASKLDILIDKYSESLWLDDAITLRLSLAAELDFMGRSGQQRVIQSLLQKNYLQKADSDESAIAALLEMRPEVAIALVKRMLEIDKRSKHRIEAVALLGQHFREESLEFLTEIAVSEDYPDVKKEANYWINRNNMSKIPTQLVYYGYSVEITDKKEKSRIPEGKINFYSIPRVNLENKLNVEKRVNQFFNQKLQNMKFVTVSTADLNLFGMETSNNIQGFNFKIFQKNMQKDWDEITGQLRFRDNETQKEFKKQFVANEKNDQLVAMRKNNKLAIILLHFSPAPDEQEQPVELPEKPFYRTEFSNVLGCKVLSTRGNFSMKEITKEGSVSDFGQAKAEIPTKNGTWVLLGNIIVDRHSRKFIARNAELSNKDVKVVLKASQIIVPVDEPEKYKVVGKK